MRIDYIVMLKEFVYYEFCYLQIFGIEVVRKFIEKEMNYVIFFDGFYVNYRYLLLLCDFMIAKGYLMVIIRYGINRQEIGVLVRCFFEETVSLNFYLILFKRKNFIFCLLDFIEN